jgi:hypothetical protein
MFINVARCMPIRTDKEVSALGRCFTPTWSVPSDAPTTPRPLLGRPTIPAGCSQFGDELHSQEFDSPGSEIFSSYIFQFGDELDSHEFDSPRLNFFQFVVLL